MKEEILNCSSKISKKPRRPEHKVIAGTNYGRLASGRRLKTIFPVKFHEKSKKINRVDQFSRRPPKETASKALKAYFAQVKKISPAYPVIHSDDSDLLKPDGGGLDFLGLKRNGAESRTYDKYLQKGYRLTEGTVLRRDAHPLKLYSPIRDDVIRLTVKGKIYYGCLSPNCVTAGKSKRREISSTNRCAASGVCPSESTDHGIQKKPICLVWSRV